MPPATATIVATITRKIWRTVNRDQQRLRFNSRPTARAISQNGPLCTFLDRFKTFIFHSDPTQQNEVTQNGGENCEDSCFAGCMTNDINECVEACQRSSPAV